LTCLHSLFFVTRNIQHVNSFQKLKSNNEKELRALLIKRKTLVLLQTYLYRINCVILIWYIVENLFSSSYSIHSYLLQEDSVGKPVWQFILHLFYDVSRTFANIINLTTKCTAELMETHRKVHCSDLLKSEGEMSLWHNNQSTTTEQFPRKKKKI